MEKNLQSNPSGNPEKSLIPSEFLIPNVVLKTIMSKVSKS